MPITDPDAAVTARYPGLPARVIAAEVRAGALDPAAVTRAALARCAQVNPVLGAVCTLFTPPVAGPPRGALAGVPMVLKDLHLAVAGHPCANGSAFPAPPAARNADYVRHCLDAGAVMIGRSHSPELGGTSSCESRHWGMVTRNPHDPALSSGGSSGGAAVAVATGIVPLAHASDAGGSITIPAALCGLVGLKPTHGLVSLGPDRIEGAAGFAAQNALARDCGDAALALAVAAGRPDLAMPAALPAGLRIGIALQAADGGATDPAIAARLDGLAPHLANAGAAVLRPVVLPDITPDLARAEARLRLASCAATVAAMEAAAGVTATPAHFEPATWARIEAGRRVTGADVLAARDVVLRFRARMLALFDDVDVIVTPALNAAAPSHGALSLSRDDQETLRLNRAYTCFARVWNLTGFPSLCLPLLRDARNRPEGVLFGAAPGHDARLLALGQRLETALGWHHDHLATRFPTGASVPGKDRHP